MNEIRELRMVDPVASVNVEGVSSHPAFEELFDRIVAEPVDGPSAFADSTDPLGDENAGVVPGRRPEHLRRRSRLLVTSVAAAVLLAVGLSAAFVGGSSISGPVTTPWRAAHALPSGERITSPRGPSGSWQLVGDIVRTGWQLNTAGPAPGFLNCPTASACYVTGDGTVRDSGPADYDSLYLSNDGGSSWAVLALPAGFSFTAPLSCSGAVVCAGGGVLNGQTVFITTIDGGHQWTVSPLSISGELVKLVCVASTCNGIAAPAAVATSIVAEGEPIPQQTNADETFVRSTNGGRTWTTYSLGANDFVVSLACPTATSCRAIGYSLSAPQTLGDFSGFVLSTNDGGTSWHDGVLPASFGFGYLSTLSCADLAHCMASGQVIAPNPYQCGVASEPIGASGSDCSSGATEEVTGIVTTTDGGTTWQLQSLPSDVPLPQLFAVSCSGASTCWVAGEEAVPQGNNGGSAVVLGTTDGGSTWAKVTFTVPPGAPNDVGGDAYMAVGSISCPSTLGCLALGVSDQGSKTTPVYSDVASDNQ